MKLFFITTNYTIYLSLILLVISTASLTAQTDETSTAQSTPTPLQVTQTAIELDNQRVSITWMTHHESDLDLFVIQRSLDGKQWEQLVAITATGNTKQQQIYQTTDSQPYEGTSFYRVGQIDFDGEEAYTEVVEINHAVPMERFFSAQHQTKY